MFYGFGKTPIYINVVKEELSCIFSIVFFILTAEDLLWILKSANVLPFLLQRETAVVGTKYAIFVCLNKEKDIP